MSDVAVLVNSFDGYAAAWPMMAHGLKTYWRDCPWAVSWMTNVLSPPMGIPICCGPEDTTWTGMMRMALMMLPCEHFLFMHEDNFLVAPVRTAEIVHYLDLMKEHSLDHIQLVPSWNVMASRGVFEPDPRLHWVAEESDYRTSNRPSLWRTQAYFELLDPLNKESAWGFEVLGSRRSQGYKCLSIAPDYHDWPLKDVYRHLRGWDSEPIVKGRWTSAAALYCEREGIPYSFDPGDEI